MIHEAPPRARAKKVVADSVARTLKQSGFKKRGDTFVRENGKLQHLVDVQWSRWSDSKEVSFTLNCGVYVPGVTSVFRNRADPEQPKLSDCCITARVGMLTDRKLDIWWKVSVADPPDRDVEVEKEISSTIHDWALPFFNRFPDPRSVAGFLSRLPEPNDKYVEPRSEGFRFAYAAIVWKALNSRAECEEYMKRAMKQSKGTPLEEVVIAFQKRFSC